MKAGYLIGLDSRDHDDRRWMGGGGWWAVGGGRWAVIDGQRCGIYEQHPSKNGDG